MTETAETFADWLRDAHAMEKQALTMLSGQEARLEHYPDLRALISRHARETEGQIDVLQGILDRYGESRSLMKDMAGRMTAMGQSLAGMMASDEVVKGALAGYTFEHMEIASYRILIATAQHLGDSQAATALQGILDQEIAMADALEKRIAGVTQTFLSRSEAGVTARR